MKTGKKITNEIRKTEKLQPLERSGCVCVKKPQVEEYKTDVCELAALDKAFIEKVCDGKLHEAPF
jgi:hypothetical protein